MKRRKAKKSLMSRYGGSLMRQSGGMICTGGFKLGSGYYWVAGDNPNFEDAVSVKVNPENGTVEISGVLAAGGPFASQAEAEAAANIAVVGDCEVREIGQWDPAWERLQ